MHASNVEIKRHSRISREEKFSLSPHLYLPATPFPSLEAAASTSFLCNILDIVCVDVRLYIAIH